jgi:uroporphyrinogen decarboxylase
MTPLERVLTVLRREEPDRVPHFEWVHDAGVTAALTNGGSYWDLVELLDIDAVMVAPAYRKQSLGDGALLDEWGVTRIVAPDGYGMVVEERTPVRDEATLAAWRPPDPDDPIRYEPIRRTVERFGGRRAIILQMRDVFSGVRDCMGYEGALVNMIEQPALVTTVVERWVDHTIVVIQRAAGLGVHIVFTGDDIADARGPLFSPRLWQNLLLPHYRRLVAAIHDAGLYHWKHSDGNLYPFLDSIVDAGTDGIDPIDPMGGMELAVVKAKYGERVAIKGNVDQVHLLTEGTPAAVAERVRGCLTEAGRGGGYVCSSSNSIHSGVRPELYRAMVEAIHTFGRYPLSW